MSYCMREVAHCDVCGHEWLVREGVVYTHCTSGKCRSRRWDGEAMRPGGPSRDRREVQAVERVVVLDE